LNAPGRLLIYGGTEIGLAGKRAMNLARAGGAGILVLALAIAGCNQETAETKAPEAPPPAPVATTEPPAPPPPAAPAPIPPATEVQVNSVDSVMLSRPEDAPNAMIIRVFGTTASAGWSLPKLEPMADGGSDSSIVSYQLVATSPEAVDDANTAPEQIVTELRVDSLPPEVTTIRIVAATNEVSAPVAQ
jgi:hypothetical protein